MKIALATTAALLAVLTGVLLAELDRPRSDAERRTERLSLMLILGTSMTAAVGVAFALIA